MPFTGSHPAAVLPFVGTALPTSALVAGSLAPDLPYYLPLTLPVEPHSALGVVTVDLVMALGLWLVWQVLLAAPALASAPSPVAARLSEVPTTPVHQRYGPRTWGWVVAALVVGAATHVAWDELTHAGRWGTDTFPSVLAAQWGPLEGYRWAQYASGLLGAVVIVGWLVRWYRRTAAVPVAPRRPWPWVVLLTAGLVVGLAASTTADGLRAAAFAGATRGGAAMMVVAVLGAVAWHVRRIAAPAPVHRGPP